MKKTISFALLLILGATSVSYASIDKNLKYGQRDKEVTELQEFLIDGGYLSGTPTTFFGLLTLKAVKTYQKSVSISPTGYVGALTRQKINDTIASDLASSTQAEIQETGTTTPVQNINKETPKATTSSTTSVVDYCKNIEGLQTKVPEGMYLDASGNCFTSNTVNTSSIDVCKNIEGKQTSIPSGMTVDYNGNCLTNTNTSNNNQNQQTNTNNNPTQNPVCVPNWQCNNWNTCTNSQQTRTCTDLNSCNTLTNKPTVTQSCTVTNTTVTVIDTCPNINGAQSSVPDGMTKGTSGDCIYPNELSISSTGLSATVNKNTQRVKIGSVVIYNKPKGYLGEYPVKPVTVSSIKVNLSGTFPVNQLSLTIGNSSITNGEPFTSSNITVPVSDAGTVLDLYANIGDAVGTITPHFSVVLNGEGTTNSVTLETDGQTTTSIVPPVIKPSPMVLWDFNSQNDVTSGLIADKVGSYNAQNINALWTSDGYDGGGLNLSNYSSGNGFKVGNVPALSQMSVMFRMKTDGLTNATGLSILVNNWNFTVQYKNGVISSGIPSGGLEKLVPVDQNWHNYTITYDGKNVTLYVDGVVKGYATGANTGATMAGDWTFGQTDTGVRNQISIDDFRIFNQVLNAETISSFNQ